MKKVRVASPQECSIYDVWRIPFAPLGSRTEHVMCAPGEIFLFGNIWPGFLLSVLVHVEHVESTVQDTI